MDKLTVNQVHTVADGGAGTCSDSTLFAATHQALSPSVILDASDGMPQSPVHHISRMGSVNSIDGMWQAMRCPRPAVVRVAGVLSQTGSIFRGHLGSPGKLGGWRERHDDGEGDGAEEQAAAEPAPQDVLDRPLESRRVAEVSAREPSGKVGVANRQRPGQTHLPGQPVDLLLGRIGANRRSRWRNPAGTARALTIHCTMPPARDAVTRSL